MIEKVGRRLEHAGLHSANRDLIQACECGAMTSKELSERHPELDPIEEYFALCLAS